MYENTKIFLAKMYENTKIFARWVAEQELGAGAKRRHGAGGRAFFVAALSFSEGLY